MTVAPFTDNEGGVKKTSTMETGVGGGPVLNERIEDAMMQKMENVVRDAEDEVDLRQDDIIYEDPDKDKIDDTDIETDENGVYKVFKSLADEEDLTQDDELEEAFKQRTKGKQIQILLAAVKKQKYQVDENNVKVNYVKKIYSEQQQKIVNLQKQLESKEEEL